jgi:hypothetical protein
MVAFDLLYLNVYDLRKLPLKTMNRLLPPMPGVCPDYPAPVVRNAGAERTGHDAVGNAAATELRRCTGTKGPTAISDPSRSSGSLVR